jgi:hypothetical protein
VKPTSFSGAIDPAVEELEARVGGWVGVFAVATNSGQTQVTLNRIIGSGIVGIIDSTFAFDLPKNTPEGLFDRNRRRPEVGNGHELL